MKQLEPLIEQRSRLIAFKDKLNSKATLNFNEGMMYVKLLITTCFAGNGEVHCKIKCNKRNKQKPW